MLTVLSVYLPTLFNEPYKTFRFEGHFYTGTTLNAMVCEQEVMTMKFLCIYFNVVTNIVETMFVHMVKNQHSRQRHCLRQRCLPIIQVLLYS